MSGVWPVPVLVQHPVLALQAKPAAEAGPLAVISITTGPTDSSLAGFIFHTSHLTFVNVKVAKECVVHALFYGITDFMMDSIHQQVHIIVIDSISFEFA
jgi:hypothetical protein